MERKILGLSRKMKPVLSLDSVAGQAIWKQYVIRYILVDTVLIVVCELIHKVKSQHDISISEAVEDIVFRSTNELRKNAFGEDAEDEKSLPWSRVQAWHVLRQLAKTNEVGAVRISVMIHLSDMSLIHPDLVP